MVLSHLNDRIEGYLNVLDALYFFVQSVPENEKRLKRLRGVIDAPRRVRAATLDELRNEVEWLREQTGAKASNSDFLDFYRDAVGKDELGHLFIPKWEIERRWFSKFDRVIVRWPYVKDHAMVIYDPKNGQIRQQVFELEGALLHDAEFLLEQARAFYKGVEDFRKRARKDQFVLHTYLRTGATVIFHFLEAYLNGLAFDCLFRHHDKLSEADHDTLLEWDCKNKRRAFVSIEKKIFRYPMIFGKCMDIKVDLSGCKPAHFLAKDAREIRDAMTHPSPHIDRESQTLRKITLITTISFQALESIFLAAKEYTITVEQALFGKPEETAPWLFPRPEDPEKPAALIMHQPT